MDNKTDKIIDKFLENHNMDYLFLILSNLESERLTNLPDFVRKNFQEKISVMSLEHTAMNEIPDFILDQIELESEEDRMREERYDYNDMSYDDDDDDDAEPLERELPPVKEDEFDDEEDDDIEFDDDDDED